MLLEMDSSEGRGSLRGISRRQGSQGRSLEPHCRRAGQGHLSTCGSCARARARSDSRGHRSRRICFCRTVSLLGSQGSGSHSHPLQMAGEKGLDPKSAAAVCRHAGGPFGVSYNIRPQCEIVPPRRGQSPHQRRTSPRLRLPPSSPGIPTRGHTRDQTSPRPHPRRLKPLCWWVRGLARSGEGERKQSAGDRTLGSPLDGRGCWAVQGLHPAPASPLREPSWSPLPPSGV